MDMKRAKENDMEALRSLLKQVVCEEATQAVWQKYGKALSALDQSSQALIQSYLGGTTPEELCRIHGLGEKDLREWLSQCKRQLIEYLRQDCDVRQ